MNASQLRIGLLVDQLGKGGAQRSTTLVATGLSEVGHRVEILSGAGGSYEADLPQGLPVHILAPQWPSGPSVIKFVVSLAQKLRRRGIDVIFTNGFTVGRLALLLRIVGLSRQTRVVVVERTTVSAAIRDRFPNRLTRWIVLNLSRWLYLRADAIVGVSDGVSRDLERALGLPAGSVTTIYNPIDSERITEFVNGCVPVRLEREFDALLRPVVITTGRLVRAKAHRDLLEAFATLPEGDRGNLVILGEGPLRQALERQADRLGIRNRVWMPGFVDNPWWFIARSDVFALSSHWEGHPRAILEALACGVPIASTDCPSGPRELLGNNLGARLSPVGDTQALAHGISDLLHNPKARSVTNLDRYKPDAVAKEYADVAARAVEALIAAKGQDATPSGCS